MWDDFYIGTPPSNRPCGARTVFIDSIPVPGLSSNSVEYWFHSSQYYLGGRISRESSVGRRISKMVEKERCPMCIYRFVLFSGIKAVPSSRIVQVITHTYKVGYEEGSNDRAAQIRKSLGLR